ncbi:MAG: hypothetical protein CMO71_00965 [Verrucomicrobiales bacterium]|nr:hypothetical protein [Verrucomicrobiales bacterium]
MSKYTSKRYGNTPLYILCGKTLRKLIEMVVELFTVPKLDKEFKNLPFSGHAMQKLIKDFKFTSILDIGSGEGLHSKALTNAGKQVTAIDYGDSVYYEKQVLAKSDACATIIADFNDYNFDCQYDAVWCSHVLEHQPNPNYFLKKIYSLLIDGGILAITVPPARNTISGGHLTNWNAGILLYNLVLAGFDCKDACVLKYGYNISIIITKRIAVFDNLSFDSGDIRKIKKCLPKLKYYSTDNDDLFNGNILKLNW